MFKQPRIPQMREGTSLYESVRELVLFLKDFCLASWAEHKRQAEEIAAIKKRLDDM